MVREDEPRLRVRLAQPRVVAANIFEMPRPCSVCKLPLEASLHETFLAGVSFQKLGARSA